MKTDRLAPMQLLRLLEGAPFAVAAYEGPQHVAIFSNPRHEEITRGRLRLGRPLVESMPELAGQPSLTVLDEVYATGEPRTLIAMPAQVLREGQLRDAWFDVTWQPMRDAAGAVTGVLVTAVEVTAHLRARQKFAAVFEHAAFAIALVRMPEAKIAEVNEAFVELFGYSREEIVGKSSVELGMHLDLGARERVRAELERTGSVRDLETTVRTKAGKALTISSRMDTIELEGQRYVLSTYRDVTRERLADRALRQSERQFRELVDNLPQLAWSAQPDGHIDFYNRRWYEYTGTTFEQMEGWGWRAVHDPAVLPAIEQQWAQAIRAGEPVEMEFPLRRADGVYRWFLTRVQPLRDEHGAIVRWVGTNTDVDDVKRARAELRSALEIREEFLSVAAHELRTPLTSLQLHVQALLRRPDAGDLTQRLSMAAKQTKRLGALVEQLLDVSRITRGRLPLQLERVELAALARDVLERQEQGLTLAADAPVEVRCDRLRIEQVITNLVTNALKYGAGKPIEVRVFAEGSDACISVSDRGIGIAREDLDRIFGRFERAVSSRHYGGLGLGLYIARNLVEAHGGRIDARSAPGDGSTFTVHLPR